MLDRGKRPHIFGFASTSRDCCIVTAILALDTNPPRDHPHRRMIEQHGLGKRLKQIDEVVMPTDVRQLVGQNCVQLRGRQARHQIDRKQNHRPQPADHRRRFDQQRLDQSHRPTDPKSSRQNAPAAAVRDAPRVKSPDCAAAGPRPSPRHSKGQAEQHRPATSRRSTATTARPLRPALMTATAQLISSGRLGSSRGFGG